jgi:hypothetical protein
MVVLETMFSMLTKVILHQTTEIKLMHFLKKGEVNVAIKATICICLVSLVTDQIVTNQ